MNAPRFYLLVEMAAFAGIKPLSAVRELSRSRKTVDQGGKWPSEASPHAVWRGGVPRAPIPPPDGEAGRARGERSGSQSPLAWDSRREDVRVWVAAMVARNDRLGAGRRR